MINLLKRFLLLVILFQSAIQATDTEEDVVLSQKEVIPVALGPRKIETILGLEIDSPLPHMTSLEIITKRLVEETKIFLGKKEKSITQDQENILYSSNLIFSHSFFKKYYKALEEWHQQQQVYIERIDNSFFNEKDTFNKKNTCRRNICCLRVTLIDDELNLWSYFFKDFLFVSGKNLDRGEEFLGIIKDLDGKNYEVNISGPSTKTKPIIAAIEAPLREHTFLKRVNKQTRYKTILCIADFYLDIEKYRDNIIEFLDLETTLSGEIANMKNCFTEDLNKIFPGQNALIQQLQQVYEKSLKRAPFSEKSINLLKDLYNFKDLDVERNFCDSEQSIRLFLTDQRSFSSIDPPTNNYQKRKKERKENAIYNKKKVMQNEWNNFKELLPENILSKINFIHVDIASRRYMCSTCENTYNYDAINEKVMLRGILANLGYKNDEVSEELIAGIGFTFLVSGSIAHSKDDEE